MMPRLLWFVLRFTWSLYSMYGVPVSIWDSNILIHRLCAFICLRNLPSLSYLSYSALNSSPYTSVSPWHSSGHMSDHTPFALTRSINRSGIHSA